MAAVTLLRRPGRHQKRQPAAHSRLGDQAAVIQSSVTLARPNGFWARICLRLAGRYSGGMEPAHEIEFIFEPQEEGGYHVYAPELPGLHTQGDDLEEATASAREALVLYVEGLREDGRALEMGIVRRKLPLPA